MNLTTKPPPGAILKDILSPAVTVFVSWTYFVGWTSPSSVSRKISAFHAPAPRNVVAKANLRASRLFSAAAYHEPSFALRAQAAAEAEAPAAAGEQAAKEVK